MGKVLMLLQGWSLFVKEKPHNPPKKPYITICHLRGPSLPVPFIVFPQTQAKLDKLTDIFSCTHLCRGRVRNIPGAVSILPSAYFPCLNWKYMQSSLAYTSYITPQKAKVSGCVGFIAQYACF